MIRRRELLGTAAAFLFASAGRADIVSPIPWRPNAADPPDPAAPGGWRFFVISEGATAEALVDRLIPPDPDTPGGKDAGCAVYLDRQLAGP